MIDQRVDADAETLTTSFVQFQLGAYRQLADAEIEVTSDSHARLRAAEAYLMRCRRVRERFDHQELGNLSLHIALADLQVADAEYSVAKLGDGD